MGRGKSKVSKNSERELARGILFLKSCQAAGNSSWIVECIKETARKNGAVINDVYRDDSSCYEYDRPELKAFLEFLQNRDQPFTIKQMEQGDRNPSMRNLYTMMDALDVDANTILGLEEKKGNLSIDKKLNQLDDKRRAYLTASFLFMLDHAAGHGIP